MIDLIVDTEVDRLVGDGTIKKQIDQKLAIMEEKKKMERYEIA